MEVEDRAYCHAIQNHLQSAYLIDRDSMSLMPSARKTMSQCPCTTLRTNSTASLLGRLRIALGHQLAHNKILAQELLLPVRQALHLVRAQPLEIVQRPLQVLCQHVLVEAVARQTPRRIAPCEIGIRPVGPVEVGARRDVKDAPAHGKVDWHAFCAVVGQQRGRDECAEEDGLRARRQRGQLARGEEACVDDKDEGTDEDEVERRDKRGSAAQDGCLSAWAFKCDGYGWRRTLLWRRVVPLLVL